MNAIHRGVASLCAVLGLMVSGCGDDPVMPPLAEAASYPVGPRIEVAAALGLEVDVAIAWAKASGWAEVEVRSDDLFLDMSSRPNRRIIFTVEDGFVVEAWAG